MEWLYSVPSFSLNDRQRFERQQSLAGDAADWVQQKRANDPAYDFRAEAPTRLYFTASSFFSNLRILGAITYEQYPAFGFFAK